MKLTAFFVAVFSFHAVFAQQVSLRDTANQFDYVIITVPAFVEACQKFKDHKEEFDGYRVLVTDTAEIYKEFNSKLTKQENIRDFISYAAAYWSAPLPKYFLLAGDLNKIPNFGYVPVPGYTNTSADTGFTDYFYAVNEYKSDSAFSNYYVGRVAAGVTEELNNYFNKVIAYENDNNLYQWNNNVLLVADDQYAGARYEGDEWKNAALNLGNNLPAYIKPQYYMENDSTGYFGNTDSVINYINNKGASAVVFIGHTNNNTFTHEHLFTINDIDRITNGDKSFVVTFLGSQNYSKDTTGSMTDGMVLCGVGALGGIWGVGLSYSCFGNSFVTNVYKELFTQEHLSLGEAVGEAFKTQRTSNNYLFNIFGDPSLRLKYDLNVAGTGGLNTSPVAYRLYQNYPNPFNPSTEISFSIPERGITKLEIYNSLGQLVSVPFSGYHSAGNYKVKFDGNGLSSGVYIYRLKSGGFTQSKKMILMK